jgi:hypothetical protein
VHGICSRQAYAPHGIRLRDSSFCLPMASGQVNNWGGFGQTLIDSLDTLWLMGLTDEFNVAKNVIPPHVITAYHRPQSRLLSRPRAPIPGVCVCVCVCARARARACMCVCH